MKIRNVLTIFLFVLLTFALIGCVEISPEEHAYTIVFETNGGTRVESLEVVEGGKLSIPTTTREGYTLDGWYTSVNGGVTLDEKWSFVSDIVGMEFTLYAKWIANVYQVSFDGQGANDEDEIIDVAVTYDGFYGELVVPDKTGYSFIGWSFDSFGNDMLDEQTVVGTASDHTLYAVWQINQYTITFDSDGGSIIDPIIQNYATTVIEPEDSTREGYTFMGWDQAVPETMPAEDIELTATWQINQYTISFDSNGGSTVESITQNYGTTFAAPEDPTREGYTFMGWDHSFPGTIPAEDVTLTAQWTINQYTITFDSDGGSIVDPITQDYTTDVTVPEDPTRDGHTFMSWSEDVPLTMPAEDVELIAVWEINTYTISFDSDGGTMVESIFQDYGTSIVAPEDPTREGYTFVGWDQAVPETMPAEDVELTAQWSIKQYTITFDSNGGSLVESITQDYGTSITAPEDPTREGYTFVRWNQTVPETMPAEDITLTAQWQINQYTISFDSNGGSAVESMVQDFRTTITAPEDPIKEGYTFLGWDQAVPETMPALDVTLTAQWSINQYTISFDSNGGSIAEPITQDYATTVTAPEDPIREGYTFVGWDQTVPEMMPALDITLTAQWSINQYTISFDSNGGSLVEPITQDYATTVIAPEDPTRDGHTFMGWSEDVPLTMPDEDVELIAVWEINTYTISFDSDGGTMVESIFQDYGTSIVVPEDPTREGYTFMGWDQAIPEMIPARDITLTAQWIINQYTITFDSNGGSVVEPIMQDYATTVTAPADPTREGYTFMGWDQAVPEKMPAGDVELTAQWQINQYTISFDSNGGSSVEPITQDYATTVTAPEDPTREGYTFAGWHIDQTFNDMFVFNQMPGEDITIYALWHNTISFEPNGGSEVASITMLAGEEVTESEAPTKEGHSFIAWFVDEGLEEGFVFSVMPEPNITLHAKWEVNQYTITFETNGGESFDSVTLDYGTSLVGYVSSREGYAFTGWYLEDTFETQVTTVPAMDVTIYAKWIHLVMVQVGDQGINYTFPSGTDDSGTNGGEGGYLMATTETTYELWYEVRIWAETHGYHFQNLGREGNDGTDGATPTDNKLEPVTTVSWYDVVVWLNAASEIAGFNPAYRTSDGVIIRDSRNEIIPPYLTENNGYRLPMSFEWEMAARWRNNSGDGSILVGGRYWTPGNYASGATANIYNSSATGMVAWHYDNSGYGTHPVGMKAPNHLGIYDMGGNVWELTFNGYPGFRFAHGGSCLSTYDLQVGHIDGYNIDYPYSDRGFRMVRTPSVDEKKINMVQVGELGTDYTVPTGTEDSRTTMVEGGYFMATTQTAYELWYTVRIWAEAHGYHFQNLGREGSHGYIGQAPTEAKKHEPVTSVAWRDVFVWCNALSEMTGLNPVYRTAGGVIIKDSRDANATVVNAAVQTNNNGYRLPTSMEWEMAARWRNSSGDGSILVGGRYWTPGSYASGATADYHNEAATRAVAWCDGALGGRFTRPVGQLLPNHLGIFDMSGNVFEWVYTSSWLDRVLRGGSYLSSTDYVQVGLVINDIDPHMGIEGNYGFRLARIPLIVEKINMVQVGELGTNYIVPTGTNDSGTTTVEGGYLMATTETTYEVWYEVRIWAEANGYHFQNQGREGSDGTIGAVPTENKLEPVTTVSWRDVIVWLNAASEMAGFNPVYRTSDGAIIKDSRDANASMVDAAVQTENNGYRLPTSYEWEMAARWRNSDGDGSILVGGRYWTPGDYASGATADYTNSTATGLVSWYDFNSGSRTHPVGEKTPNHLGLYDMSGNIWEWIYDWHPIYEGSSRIHRGGSYGTSADHPQVGYFSGIGPHVGSSSLGFRMVRTP